MTGYLLDTNIVSELVYDPHGEAARRVRTHSLGTVFTSIIVECEMRYGAVKRNSERLNRQIEAILQSLTVKPFEAPAQQFYAALRADLERRGLRIGDLDMLIAAHALALDATLVTANTREFERIEDLRVENWLA